MRLIDFDNGFRHFQKEVREKELVKSVNDKHYMNQRRYGMLVVNGKEKLRIYFYAFKRDFYRKFGEEFKEKGESGLGESVNTDLLREMIRLNNDKGVYEKVMMFFGYPDGKVYSIHPEMIVSSGYKRETIAEGKSVYSFSIKHLVRYNE